MSSDQVQQRKQKNPDDVDEMPVEARDLDGRRVRSSEAATPCHDQQRREDPETDDHVERVETRHREIE
jgi:hypothetical protein